MKWWLSSGDKPEGPFPAEHVAEWLRSGQISPDTTACPEGGQEWKRLDEIDEFARLVPPPPPRSEGPPPPPPGAPSQAAPAALSGSPGSVRAKFGLLMAAIVLSAAALFLEFMSVLLIDAPLVDLLMFGAGVASLATWLVFHYQLWALIPAEHAETTPGRAVGFLFIPFYNFYWVFQSCVGVARSLNRLAESRGFDMRKASTGFATAYSVCMVALFSVGLAVGAYSEMAAEVGDLEGAAELEVCSFVVFSVPIFVFWLLMVLDQRRMVEHLLRKGAPVNTASGLIER